MPINYKKYPENWLTEIRPRILERANHKCENCGLENYSIVHSYKQNKKIVWDKLSYGDYMRMEAKAVKVILTIAHLDHDETNQDITDDRLKAMCQLCHLRYDADEKKRRRSSSVC